MAGVPGIGFWVERIEPRILFAADHPALMGLHLGAAVDLAQPDLDAPVQDFPGGAAASEIVFIDAHVDDADGLIAALQASQPGRALEVHTLAAGQDAFAQIDAILDGRHDVGALHLIGHGESGQITLGGSVIDRASLLAHSADLGQWGQALRQGGDILVYGCDTGAGSEGLAWTQTLATLSGADVAASTDLTGSAALGGNWVLEREVGSLDVHPLALAAAQDWQGVLATYTVTNTNASGAGSLAQAISDANTNPGHDTIDFNITPTGTPHIIVLNGAGALPSIVDSVTIDATTQSDYAGKPMVVIDGQGLPAASTGLDLGAGSDGSTVKGLAVTHFANGGIGINIVSSNNTIQNNYLGVDPAGNSAANSYGLIVGATSSGNLIGGTLAQGNLISGNDSGGVVVRGFSNTLSGNLIGTTADGLGAQGNNGFGLVLENGSHDNTVGSGSVGSRNLISGNYGVGLLVQGDHNEILGNYVGTNLAGDGPIANTNGGVELANSASNNHLTANVISGNNVFGVLYASSGSGNSADHNLVGLSASGGDLGYNGVGIAVQSGSGFALSANRIAHNSNLGIDLGFDYIINANDAGDVDGGPNNGQNHPTLSGATFHNGQLSVSGSLNSLPGGSYVVELFVSDSADPSGYGPGDRYLGSATVTTDASGNAVFTLVVNATISVNQVVSMTARNVATGDTSEFSNALNIAIVSNTAPVITSDGGGAYANVDVAENSTYVTTVTASDANGDALSYSVSNAGGGTDGGFFSIDASTGVLSFKLPPDYEVRADDGANGVYDVLVHVSDGSAETTQWIVVRITDVNEPPVITSNGGGSSAAVSVAEGTNSVTTVSASDPDAGASLNYSISGGADAARFTIDATTGTLSFRATPDFEAPTDAGADNVYDVVVQVSDGTNVDTQAIAVTVTNVNEAPVITSDGGGAYAHLDMAENSTYVTTVTATDAEGDTLSYSITNAGALTDVSFFSIDPTTGVLTFKLPPDYELPVDTNANGLYDVQVHVSDGTHDTTQWIVVHVTDVNEPPVITSNGGGSSAAVSVAEGASSVTTVSASDPDQGASLSYTISGGADAAHFTIDATTGALSFRTAPDFEAPTDAGGDNVYDVVVQVSDGTNVDTQAIAVTVTNVNEPPVITSDGGGSAATVSVAENSSAVTTVVASDVDAASTLTYSITGGADAGRFVIDATTGQLRFASAPDFEAPTDANGDNVYDVVVQVSDGTNVDTQAIVVTVSDLNDNAPVILSNGGGANALVSVAENGVLVTTVTASDADATSTLTYSISGGADAGRFVIDASTGQLRFASAPDFEAPTDANGDNVYDVVVQVSDGTNLDTQALAVTVTNVNEPPVVTSDGGGSTATVSVAENTSAVTTVVASDVDAASTLTYSITGGADAGRFVIDATTGQLRFASAPDFEAPIDANGDNVYDVVVQVSDGTNVDTQAIAVTVSDLNDNAPRIVSNGGESSAVVQVLDPSRPVTTVVAVDADTNSRLSYAISGGADAALFDIDGQTGALTFRSLADAVRSGHYEVVVVASDGVHASDQTLSVVVTPDSNVGTILPPSFTDAGAGSILPAPVPAGEGDRTASGGQSPAATDTAVRSPSDTRAQAPATTDGAIAPVASVEGRGAAAGLVARSLSFQLPAIRVADVSAGMLQLGERETPRLEVARASGSDLLSQLLLRVDEGGRLHVAAAEVSVEAPGEPPGTTRFIIEQGLHAGAVGATLGLLWWLQRLVLVFGGGLAAAPVWRRLDPVPVLPRAGRRDDVLPPPVGSRHASREESRA